MRLSKCALCLEGKELRESHIIPKFLWRRAGFLGSPHFRRNADETKDTKKYHQDGPKEKLLCGSCEQRCGRYETYFSNKFYKPGGLFHEASRPVAEPGTRIKLNDLYFAKVKLFGMVTFYKVFVSNLPEYSSLVGPSWLRPDDLELLRMKILQEDAEVEHEFSLSLHLLGLSVGDLDFAKGSPDRLWVMPPYVDQRNGLIRFVIDGILYSFFPSTNASYPLSHDFPRRDGSWVLHHGHFRDYPELMWAYKEIKKRGEEFFEPPPKK